MITTTATAPVTRRDKVRWGDLAWLTWRQHRWAITGLVGVFGAVVVLALGLAWHIDSTGDVDLMVGGYRFLGLGQLLVLGPMAIGLAVAVFWAAPLLSREYEQRTHVVVWSQDVTPTRWLVGKVALLGVPAAALSVGVGLAVTRLLDSLNAALSEYAPLGRFETPAFEAAPVVQFAYTAFGFGLGLALSAVTRRTVLSMGLTLGLFLAARVVVSGLWRPNFQEPLRVVEPYDAEYAQSWSAADDGALTVDSGFVDAAGKEIPFPPACSDTQDGVEYVECLRENDVQFFTDYHPVDRLVPFQLFESAIFTALAAGLFVFAFAWVRRARRV